MTHIIDRRKNPSGKSLPNRQKFLERAKAQIRKAVRKSTEGGSIEDVLKGGSVSIPVDGINEPFFHATGGIRDTVFPGNKKFSEGDILERSGGGGGSEAGEGDSIDDFRFPLSREEFLDLFLGDLELPDLVKRKLIETESEGLKRAGYSTSGSPSNISIPRTSKKALARRMALRRPSDEEIEGQLKQSEQAWLETEDEGIWAPEYVKYLELVRRAKITPWIDPIDVRYRRFEPQPKPNSQAVMFCLMDVSGSMSEHMKDLAKRFYMLLYVFLVKCYGIGRVKIVFIRHTDTATEVDEETFFRGAESGGTKISPSLALMKKIVEDRFGQSDWNIYCAQASDGDNQSSDNALTSQLMSNEILPMCQHFAYLEVCESGNSNPFHSPKSGLWETYEHIKSEKVPLTMRKVSDRSEIYPVFRELFKKRMPGVA